MFSVDTVCDDPGTATDAVDSLWTISYVQTGISSVAHADSKGNPRNVTNSKGKKRRPNSKDLSTILKTNDPLFLDFIRRCLEYVHLRVNQICFLLQLLYKCMFIHY